MTFLKSLVLGFFYFLKITSHASDFQETSSNVSKNVTMELKVFHLNIDIKLFMKSTEQLLVNSFIYFATKRV